MTTRILHIVPTLDRGGIEQSLIRLCRYIDRERFQIDFLVYSQKSGALETEAKKLGCAIFHVCSRRDGIQRNRKELAGFFREHRDYSIVIQHVSSLSYLAPLSEAESAGIPIRVLHCHNTREGVNTAARLPHRMLHEMHRIPSGFLATDFCACSSAAAHTITGEKAWLEGRMTILPNAIPLSDYRYDAGTRAAVREQLGLEPDTILFGHVGRLCPQKNQRFLLETLQSALLSGSDTKLLLVGKGEDEEVLKKYSLSLGIEKSVIFYGESSDTARLYQAMDVFLFPSRHEGLGMAVVEAQASGLPCLVSETVPEEALYEVLVMRRDDTPACWAERALSMAAEYREIRADVSNLNQKALSRYDAPSAAVCAEAYYEKLLHRLDGKLHVLQVRMDAADCVGGIGVYLRDLYRETDREKIRFSFLTSAGQECAFREELEELGADIYPLLARKRDGLLAHHLSLRQFYAAHPEITVLHGNYGQLHSLAEYRGGKQVPVKIFHAHSTDREYHGPAAWMEAAVNRRYVIKHSDLLLACSEQAGAALLKCKRSSPDESSWETSGKTSGTNAYRNAGKPLAGKHFQVMPDGIIPERFAFDWRERERTRRELGLEGRTVYGHVGRFTWQKNQEFLLKIFGIIRCRDPSAVLLLVGSGEREKEEELRALAYRQGIGDAVRFTGQRNDVERLYQAMDVFLFPSRYEGFGIVLLEAQAAGLPVLASAEAVPQEAVVLDSFQRLSLKEGADVWAAKAIALTGHREADAAQKVKEAGLDSRAAAKRMEKIYRLLAHSFSAA